MYEVGVTCHCLLIVPKTTRDPVPPGRTERAADEGRDSEQKPETACKLMFRVIRHAIRFIAIFPLMLLPRFCSFVILGYLILLYVRRLRVYVVRGGIIHMPG